MDSEPLIHSIWDWASEELQVVTGGDELPKKGKAVRLVDDGAAPIIENVDVPEPGPSQVLIEMSMCSVSSNDLSWKSNYELERKLRSLPRTLGCGGVGRVVKNGPGACRFHEGARVCLGFLADACLDCEDCLSGFETTCTRAKIAGWNTDGHLTQYFVANEAFLCPVPDEVSDEEACPLSCDGVATYKALKESGLRCGQWVIIVGGTAAGSLEYFAVQFAKAMGLKVISVVKQGGAKAEWLKQFHGTHVLDWEQMDVIDEVNRLTSCGAHGAVILNPSNGDFEAAQKCLRRGGKLVIVGQPSKNVKLDATMLRTNMITVAGSNGGSRLDLVEALDFVADGTVKSDPTVQEFDEYSQVLDDLSSESIMGPVVLRIPPPHLWEQIGKMVVTKGDKEFTTTVSRRTDFLAQYILPIVLTILIAIVFMYTIYGRSTIGRS